LYGLDRASTNVVGIGLEPFDVDRAAFAQKFGVTAPYVIYSGRREPLKGIPLLVDYLTAFRARTRRDIKAVFTGSGPIDPPSELAPHVIDLGFASETDKHEAMAGAVAFCHPSVNESLSIVLLESWLARTPALVREASEVLRYQCKTANGGLWFRNYPEFEEELLALLDNQALRTAMGNSGREYVLKEYSWKTIEPKLLEALDKD
jgi:glycosyltransferase involved in cell wall biosynthesis